MKVIALDTIYKTKWHMQTKWCCFSLH